MTHTEIAIRLADIQIEITSLGYEYLQFEIRAALDRGEGGLSMNEDNPAFKNLKKITKAEKTIHQAYIHFFNTKQ